MKKKQTNSLVIVFFLLFSTFGMINLSLAAPIISSRTYTIDADFDEGVLVGLEHDTVHDQLQLSKEHVTLPFIWVPNQQGTVSKVNTETGKELGRYWVAPFPASPSRTTVDLYGNCWVGNRQAGTVVKIGLYEAGIWDDRNNDGIIQTSMDLNGDGDITGDELLPWGEDECVLFEVNLFQGNLGTYVPGTYPGPYDTELWRTSPRGLAIDADNNLWAGTCPGTIANLYSYPSTYYHIDGETGAIKEHVVMSGHAAYGAVIDPNGILWSSMRPTGIKDITPFLVRFDPSTLSRERIYLQNRYTYGLGLDYLGNLFVSGWNHGNLHRVNTNRFPGASFPQSGLGEWTKGGPNNARGVACTTDNHVWVASTSGDRVYRYDNNGNHKTNIYVGNGPTGVAVDAVGKVWVCNLYDDTIRRIDPATNTVDMTKHILGSGLGGQYHYGYSDMTGIMARTITTRIGTWTVTFDSDESDTPWGTVSWKGEEPVGTSITVKVRSSNDESTWSAWETVIIGEWLSSTPNGQYLQIETTLQIVDGEVSPILYDLTVNTGYLDATIDFDPDTLNSKSKGKWVTVYIELPVGYDVNDIDIESIMLGGVIPAETKPTGIGDYDNDVIPDLMVKFNRSAVIDLLPVGDTIYVMIYGTLGDGTPFIGTDVIRVI
jgi:DNA-binding beta-propeller fold protein YncE